MSFLAYFDNIEAKAGKSEVKAGEIVQWLKGEFELGLGLRWRSTRC